MMSEDVTGLNLSKPTGRVPTNVSWLADAPLFIDTDQVERFYDAVVRPNNVHGETKLTLTEETAKELEAKLGLKVGISPSDALMALTSVLPFLKPSIEGSGEGTLNKTTTTGKAVEVSLKEINTPQRQLEQLMLHYLLNQPRRMFVTNNLVSEWTTTDVTAATPRAVLFLDLPGSWEARAQSRPQTKLIPTAAEFENGRIQLLFDKLKGASGEKPELYPENADTEEELLLKRKCYWKWFDQHFSASRAMRTIEEVSSEHGRIRWIDYRVPLSEDGQTLHLHIVPGGRYDTGVFAYNFVKRGFTHGLRLVGTLKSGPDMNVLAIYEK